MPFPLRVAALTLAACLASASVAFADDDDTAAFSSAPTLLTFCGGDYAILVGDGCQDGSYARLATELDRALQAALAKLPANVRPLLKRDQYWFGETLGIAAQYGYPQPEDPADRDAVVETVRRRIASLTRMTDSVGRAGVLGQWDDAFGSVTVMEAEPGAYRLSIDTDSGSIPDDDRHWRCRASALVKPAGNGWLAGDLVLATKKEGAGSPNDDPPALRLPIRMRRQGETLRIVVTQRKEPFDYGSLESCRVSEQVTSTYFASGKAGAAPSDRIDTSFVAPTFDCARPVTESDEEICADPDLASQDVRLNRAWKALLPRLDEATRRALIEDQRSWIREQAGVFPTSLHPAADKPTSDLHHVGYAREMIDLLQRERIALLEGFDENRKGLVGLWLGHTAILNVTSAGDGAIEAKGWKWDWTDYKAGCTYEMQGKATGSGFRAGDGGKNPDTLERDHAMLIVNRLDDVFARKRNGTEGADEMKCLRSMQASSTVRLFPVRYSPDIDNTGQWHR
jgi:uncharacterized protein YecT (DUF1311 family)